MASVTAVIPSYNHSAYLIDAIESVLNQSEPVAEIIVVDDCSIDDSVKVINSLADERIKLIVNEKNLGGAETLNIGIRNARSEWIAICNSDDIWDKNKIKIQMEMAARQPETAAFFTEISFVDKVGKLIDDSHTKPTIFRQPNRNRFDWMNTMFFHGNCLCHPSVMIKRSVYEKIGFYDNRYRQLPDYDFWMRLLQFFPIHVTDQKLLKFRVHDNTSRSSLTNLIRDRNEFYEISSKFIRDLNKDNFVHVFGSALNPSDNKYSLDVEKALFLWRYSQIEKDLGLDLARHYTMKILAEPGVVDAWHAYGLKIQDFHLLSGLSSPWVYRRKDSELNRTESEVYRRVVSTFDLRNVDVKAPHVQMGKAKKFLIKLLALMIHPFSSVHRKVFRRKFDF